MNFWVKFIVYSFVFFLFTCITNVNVNTHATYMIFIAYNKTTLCFIVNLKTIPFAFL